MIAVQYWFISTIQLHELAICPLPLKPPSHFLPFPTPLSCYRAPV